MIVEHGTLIVAADGGGAVIYRNIAKDGAPKLEIVETHDAKHESSATAGSNRALAGHDYHEQGERQFAGRLATRLDELVGGRQHGKDEAGIVLFASPRFLGVIRSDYSARLKTALKAEVGKDLRAAAVKQIEQAVTSLNEA